MPDEPRLRSVMLAQNRGRLGREGGRAAVESCAELKTVLLPFSGEMM